LRGQEIQQTAFINRNTMNMKKTVFITLHVILVSIASQSQEFYKDWNLYKNHEFHFEVQYPNEVFEINSFGKIPEERKQLLRDKDRLPFYQEKQIFSIDFGDKVVPLFSIQIYEYAEEFDLETFCFNIIRISPDFIKKEDIKFENYPFNKYMGLMAIYQNTAGGYDGMNKRIFIKRDNLVFDISIYGEGNRDYNEFLMQVMNTFKFTK
jgi:hypothetical protein